MARKRWAHKAGGYGTRVIVEERQIGGRVRLKTFSPTRGDYVSRSMGFAVRDTHGKLIPEAVDRAKAAAAELVNARLKKEAMPETTRPSTRAAQPVTVPRSRARIEAVMTPAPRSA